HVALGQLVAEVDGLRALIGRQGAVAIIHDGLGRQCRVLAHDEQRHHLTRMRIALCDRGDFQHTGAARRHFLDLVRVYLEARHDDHVFLAVLDEYEAARIDAPDVPGSQPAIRQHHLRGLVGTLPVTLHDLRATHADLPHRAGRRFGARLVADRYIGGGQWQAHRTVEVRVGPDEG